jgi:hypothetical protein
LHASLSFMKVRDAHLEAVASRVFSWHGVNSLNTSAVRGSWIGLNCTCTIRLLSRV